MKRLGLVLAAVGVMVFAIIPRGMALEEYPGAFQFGDSGPCDGVIGPEDGLNVMRAILGIAGDYSGCTPPCRDIQEVNGNATMDPGDVLIIRSWIIGLWATGDAGKPYTIEVADPFPSIAYMQDGDSVELRVRVWDNPALGDLAATLRPGWGVVFKVLPSSDCLNALIYGRALEPIGGEGKGQFEYNVAVYNYTDSFLNGGWASARLWTRFCNPGDVIYVETYIPSDAEANLSGSRFPARLTGPTFTATIVYVDPVVTGIAIDQPDPIHLVEGSSVVLSATCTYADLSSDDCTRAGGLTWSASGELIIREGSRLIAPQVPCGAGGSGTVTVWLTSNPAISDIHGVIVDNEDTIASTLVAPAAPSVLEGQTVQFSLTRTWSDACQENLTAGATWRVKTGSTCSPKGTITVNGLYTAGKKGCSAGCLEEVDATAPVSDNTAAVTVLNDDTFSHYEIVPSCADVLLGGYGKFYLYEVWSDYCQIDLSNGAGWYIGGGNCMYSGMIWSDGTYQAPLIFPPPTQYMCSEWIYASAYPAVNQPAEAKVHSSDMLVICLP